MTAPVLATVLVALAIVAWPPRSRACGARSAWAQGVEPIRDGPNGSGRRSGVATPGRGPLARRARARLSADLADALAVMSSPVRAGVPPGVALRVAADALPDAGPLSGLFAELTRAEAHGMSLGVVWRRQASRSGDDDLDFIGRAWLLSERTGAPLAAALDSAEQVIRARAYGRLRLATSIAGPRASMTVLTLLPCCGPIVGLAFGVGPAQLYASSDAAMSSAGLGVVLGLGAWWWSRRIIDHAVHPTAGRRARS